MPARGLRLLVIWGLGIVLLVAGTATWLRQPPAAGCAVCQRPIHANTHVLALVDGRQIEACCPRCVLTLRTQYRKDAQFLEVSDYLTARPLRPETAYYVEGSIVEVCCAPRLKLAEERTPYMRRFDRCSPSLLAFAREDEARDFIANYGGSLKRLDELLREAAPRPVLEGER